MHKLLEKIQLQLDRIDSEVQRAMQIHSTFYSDHHAYAVMLEELEEYWELVKLNPAKLSEEKQRKRNHDMQKELIQLAAMCIRATIDLDYIGAEKH